MEERGRKSVAELAVVATKALGRLPDPPADLTDAEAAYWRAVVATKPAEWWKEDSAILLKAYCRASVQHDVMSQALRRYERRLNTEKGLVQYERIRKMITAASSELATLATKMRLAQQSRYDTQKAATRDRVADGARPWEGRRSA
jgi:hypothetical protein